MYEFSSKYPAVISIIIIVIAAAASYFSYRKRNLTKFSRTILVSLRSLAISLLLILFIEPSLLAFINKHPESYNIILIDDSRSNKLPLNAGTKLEQIKEYFSSSGKLQNNDKQFVFSSGLKFLPVENSYDSLKGNGYESNISAALKELREVMLDDKVKSVTVISDGNFNAGENPLGMVKLFRCPFNTIGVGDSAQKKDILINRINFNQKAFTKTPVKITILLDAYKCKGESIELNLFREGSKISQKIIPVNSDGFSVESEFEVSEQNPGIVRYQASLNPIKDEVTSRNNSTDFLISYIDNSVKILFISGGPGYDNAIIEPILKRIEDYKVSIYTLKTPNSFYEGQIEQSIYPDLSAIFLLNFPISSVQNEFLNDIAEKIRKFNIPLIFFAGKNTDYQKLSTLDSYLPFSLTKSSSGESTANLQIVSKSENSGAPGFGKDLGNLPPVSKNVSGVIQKTGTEVLIIDKSSGEPVLINRNSKPVNSTAFIGYGFWKWKLDSRGSNEKTLEKLITGAVSITLNKEKKQRVKLEASKDEFDYMENCIISAQVFDENFNPTQNAILKGRLKGKASNINKDITFVSSNNSYNVNLGTLPADDYIIEAEAEFNNTSLGKDLTRFIVDTTNAEFKTTKSNFAALRQLSENSGGGFYKIDDNKKLNEVMASVTESDINKGEVFVKYERFNLWENKYILLAIVLILSIEWYIKKRSNIP
jgi:hypothetical protein